MAEVSTVGDAVAARGRGGLWVAQPEQDGALGVSVGPHPQALVRVEHDVPRLTRAATRLLAEDAEVARRFAELIGQKAGVPRVQQESPVRSIVRATLPLLSPVDPWPAPPLPIRLSPEIQRAFRAPTPRAAAAILWPGRATRPVIAALAAFLCRPRGAATHPTRINDDRSLDVFAISVAHAVGPLLQPDHLVRVLETDLGPFDPAPLTTAETDRLRLALGSLPARRIVDLARQSISEGPARQRLRHVAATASSPLPRTCRSWAEIAAHEILDGAAPAQPPTPRATRPAAPPAALPARVPGHDLTMHLVTSAARLRTLSVTLRNCLDTYAGQLTGTNRIVEFRRNDQPVYAAHLRRGRIVTLEASGNRRPPADELPRLRQMLTDANLLATPPQARPRRGGSLLRDDLTNTPVSLQALATATAQERREDADTDWCELGAALWCRGAIEELPDPTQPATRQVMLDVAVELAAGTVPSNRHEPSPERRQAEHDRLRARAAEHGLGWWQCLVMADILARPVVA